MLAGYLEINEVFTVQKTLTLTKLAQYLGIHKRTLHRMIEDGRFPVKPVEGLKPRRWNIEDVDAWRLGK